MDIEFQLFYREILADVNDALLALGLLAEYSYVAIGSGCGVLLAVGALVLVEVAESGGLVDVDKFQTAFL